MFKIWSWPLLAGLLFVDAAEDSGLDFHHTSGSSEKKHVIETVSGGVAWIDYNQDGWPDLYLVNEGHWDELVQGKRSLSNRLYRNNADGSFSDVSKRASIGDRHWGMAAAVGDYDGDGWLDLYVSNYVSFDHATAVPLDCRYRGIVVHCGPEWLNSAPDILYHNNGDGTFSQSTQEAGMGVEPANGLGAVWFDYDNDADQDLYVANDSMANYLFQNQGDGTFQEVAVLVGVAYNQDGREQAGMGVDVGDYDRDGFFDIYVTNFSDDYNTLYRNLGNGLFWDVTYGAELGFPSWQFLGWGTVADLDNDRWEDLFVANGHIFPRV